MNPGGSLQLVSRVLSKTSMTKDSSEEQTERTAIRVNNVKCTEEVQSQAEPITLGDLEAIGREGRQEEMVVAPDITDYKGKVFSCSLY